MVKKKRDLLILLICDKEWISDKTKQILCQKLTEDNVNLVWTSRKDIDENGKKTIFNKSFGLRLR